MIVTGLFFISINLTVAVFMFNAVNFVTCRDRHDRERERDRDREYRERHGHSRERGSNRHHSDRHRRK